MCKRPQLQPYVLRWAGTHSRFTYTEVTHGKEKFIAQIFLLPQNRFFVFVFFLFLVVVIFFFFFECEQTNSLKNDNKMLHKAGAWRWKVDFETKSFHRQQEAKEEWQKYTSRSIWSRIRIVARSLIFIQQRKNLWLYYLHFIWIKKCIIISGREVGCVTAHGLQVHMMVMSRDIFFWASLWVLGVFRFYWSAWYNTHTSTKPADGCFLFSRMLLCGHIVWNRKRRFCLWVHRIARHINTNTRCCNNQPALTHTHTNAWPSCSPRWTQATVQQNINQDANIYIVIYLNYFITLLSVIICRFLRPFASFIVSAISIGQKVSQAIEAHGSPLQYAIAWLSGQR